MIWPWSWGRYRTGCFVCLITFMLSHTWEQEWSKITELRAFKSFVFNNFDKNVNFIFSEVSTYFTHYTKLFSHMLLAVSNNMSERGDSRSFYRLLLLPLKSVWKGSVMSVQFNGWCVLLLNTAYQKMSSNFLGNPLSFYGGRKNAKKPYISFFTITI